MLSVQALRADGILWSYASYIGISRCEIFAEYPAIPDSLEPSLGLAPCGKGPRAITRRSLSQSPTEHTSERQI
jgi:hypothetical protein